MHHGIVIDQSFKDNKIPEGLRVFAHRQAGAWGIYGIEVEDSSLDKTIREIQEKLNIQEPWYCHFYNGQEIIIVFKDKTFRVTFDKSTWKDVTEYGLKLGIPQNQLGFYPQKFEQEAKYFRD